MTKGRIGDFARIDHMGNSGVVGRIAPFGELWRLLADVKRPLWREIEMVEGMKAWKLCVCSQLC